VSHTQPSPPAGPPAYDAWNSPLWANPDTVAGTWAPQAASQPTFEAFYDESPVAKKSRVLPIVAGVMAAALIGVGAMQAFSRTDDTSVASPSIGTSSPTPVSPNATPTIPNPNAQDPNAQDPNAQDPNTQDPNAQDPNAQDPNQFDPNQIPGIGGLPGAGNLPGNGNANGSGSGAADDPAAAAQTTAVDKGLVNIQSTIGYDGSAAAGTGVVLTSDGIVLTNHHVIAGSTSLSVAVAGTTTNYSADVIGYDASHDIGVIKLRNASGLATAPLGDSNTVKIGDAVVGTGNAGGGNGAPIHAAGKVTGLGKSITAMDSANGASEELTNLIETDANIQPGDSGGALASSDKVIGINTAGSTSNNGQGSGATDGFAIPINDALAIANDIRAGRASSTIHIGASAFLGISVRASSFSGSAGPDGVSVARVLPNSAASKAGLVAGDVITGIGGATVTDNTALRDLIAPHHPGDTVSITWTDVRGASHTQDVTFGSGPVG